MTGATAHRRWTLLLKGALVALALAPLSACGDDEPLVTSEAPLVPIEPLAPPLDSTPAVPDPIVPPPTSGDSTPLTPPLPGPGPDSVPPPPAPEPMAPSPPPEHVGIPFGAYHLPGTVYGPRFSGTLMAVHPWHVIAQLDSARRAGARVVIGMVGSERRMRGPDGHFSLAQWKHRLDRFRGIDLTPYIEDGTVIGHYIMDEPHDRGNWAGATVSLSDIDAMAKYSKELWPAVPTIIRGWPDFLKGYHYEYLDAAWAQYSDRFGDIDKFISDNVRDARASGLRLVVGLNLLAGGGRNGLRGYLSSGSAMTASQVRQWGGKLLDEQYICAFISWRYDADYFSRSDIKSALEDLSDKARSLPKGSCSK